MLKTPPSKISKYTNGSVFEHIACLIFKSLGFKTQVTCLGYYNFNGKKRLCVLCKDFETDGKKLFKFAEIKNGVIDSSESGYGVELSLVLDAIDHQVLVPLNELKEFFWDMFIADVLLGNFEKA